MAEHRFRKAGVVGSNPTFGFYQGWIDALCDRDLTTLPPYELSELER